MSTHLISLSLWPDDEPYYLLRLLAKLWWISDEILM
jgi:hypothetical protein